MYKDYCISAISVIFRPPYNFSKNPSYFFMSKIEYLQGYLSCILLISNNEVLCAMENIFIADAQLKI